MPPSNLLNKLTRFNVAVKTATKKSNVLNNKSAVAILWYCGETKRAYQILFNGFYSPMPCKYLVHMLPWQHKQEYSFW